MINILKKNLYLPILLSSLLATVTIAQDNHADHTDNNKSYDSLAKNKISDSNNTNQTQIANTKTYDTTDEKAKNNEKPKYWHITQQNTDIREFISQVAKIVGKTFVIDPKIKGGNSVSILSSKPLNSDDVFDVFCQVMAVNGYSVIYKGNVINIIPQALAKNSSNFGDLPANHGVITTRVLELENMPAMEAVSIVKPLISQFGHVAASISANSIVISDVVENINNIQQLLSNVDTSSDYEVIQIKNAWVTDVAHIISTTLNSRANNMYAVQIIADENTNRLIIKGNSNKRSQIKKLITTLDNSSTQKNTTKVLFLKHADAKNIAQILAEASNSLINTKGAKRNNGVRSGSNINNMLSQPNMSKSGSPMYSAQIPGVFIKPDESQNALVMIAEPDILKELENIVRKLDTPRSQVLLEAVIVEVSNNFSNEFGISWENIGNTAANIAGSAAAAAGGSVAAVAQDVAKGGLTAANFASRINPTKAGDFNITTGNMTAILQALKKDTKNNILSTPSILTLDNTKSEFLVGENIPIQTGSYQTTGANQNPFITKERKDVGIQLKVTPHINAGDSLRLVIEQEVSSLDPLAIQAANSNNDIVYKNRSLKTTVLVANKQTIVIGGLIENNYTTVRRKIPILGDIPILGRLLFSYNSKQRTKKNLMLFLRPTIITSADDLSSVTTDKYSSLKIIGSKTKDAPFIDMPDYPEELVEYTSNTVSINNASVSNKKTKKTKNP